MNVSLSPVTSILTVSRSGVVVCELFVSRTGPRAQIRGLLGEGFFFALGKIKHALKSDGIEKIELHTSPEIAELFARLARRHGATVSLGSAERCGSEMKIFVEVEL